MTYAHRTGGKRWRHDPASHGIFIHGGSNNQPKWYSCDHFCRRQDCNRFMLTLPSTTKHFRDDSPEMNMARGNSIGDPPSFDYRSIVEPTFQRILARAMQLRRDFPWLAECGIYTCTEFAYDRKCHSAGTLEVQLVAPPEPLDWDAISAFGPLPDSAAMQLRRALDEKALLQTFANVDEAALATA